LRSARLEPRYAPTFVVGVPRSGTTLTTLVLWRSFRWAYIPERANRHPEFTLLLSGLSALSRRSDHGEYSNEYGSAGDPAAISDGWELFHRWFPRYDLGQPTRENRLGELVTLVRSLERLFRAPFLLKNNNNSTRIDALRRVFPDAVWVHVKRDPVDTSLSLLEARRRFGVGVNEWWSAAPPAYWNRTFRDEVEQVAHQVVGVERGINDGLIGLPALQLIRVSYEDICADPTELIASVAARYESFGKPLTPAGPVPSSFVASRPVASHLEREKVTDALSRVRSPK
jgi:hypothetical protein